MKTTFVGSILTLAVALLCLAPAACTKEDVAGDSDEPAGGVRVISACFQIPTKTTLEGLSPKFVDGDVIAVSNGKASEECTIRIGKSGKPVFSTRLYGTLKAVYPAEAAVMDGMDIKTDTVRISAVQTGKFADANICMATGISDSTASFKNKASILRFYVDKAIGVKSFTVSCDGAAIASGGSSSITVSTPAGTLDAVSDDPLKRLCYVAILPGVNLNKLTFTSDTKTQSMVTRTPTLSVTFEAGTIYNAFLPYWIKIGSQKWGYCNVGAFLPEDSGYFFAWGYTEGLVRNASNNGWVLASDKTTVKQFRTSYFPYRSTFEDAATYYWGPQWRVPSSSDSGGEFGTMVDACNVSVVSNYLGSGRTVRVFTDKNDNTKQIVFPRAGWGENGNFSEINDSGNYWSRTPSGDYGYVFRLSDGYFKNWRFKATKNFGFNLRAILN